MSLQIGSTVGAYRIEAPIGSGGFATVYQARDDRLDTSVAIKVLADNYAMDPDARGRFFDEARMIRKVRSDHLVSLHDVGETPSGQPFLVLQLADRGDLYDRVTNGHTNGVDLADITPVISLFANALGDLHSVGLVHRDIKPQNILITSRARSTTSTSVLVEDDERLLLGDLGFAKDLNLASGYTSGGGSRWFQAPEQLPALVQIDQRADIYAATAVIAWLLVASAPPSGTLTWEEHLTTSGVDPTIIDTLRPGLAENPDNRPDNITQWLHLIETLTTTRTHHQPPQQTVKPLASPAPQPTSTQPNVRRPTRTALAGALLVGIIALAIILSRPTTNQPALATVPDPTETASPTSLTPTREDNSNDDETITAAATGLAAVANPELILREAEQLFTTTALADGTTVTDNQKCFFSSPDLVNQVVCGPVWLGNSPTDEPWLEIGVDYSTVAGEKVGTATTVTDTTSSDPTTFTRPDGIAPAQVTAPVYPTTGPRTKDGELIADLASGIENVQTAFNETARTADPLLVSVSPDALCFFVEGPETVRAIPITKSTAFCGPVRTTTSDPDETWIQMRMEFAAGPTYGSLTITGANLSRFNTTSGWLPRQAAIDQQLTRPDNATPITPDLLVPPPQPTNYLDAFSEPEFGLTLTGSGQLITTEYTIDFDGFGRVAQLGTGADALVAAPGHEFAIATIAGRDQFHRPDGAILIDGQPRALKPNWAVGSRPQLLVISIPTDTQTVELTVTDNDQTQTISLDNGTLARN